MFLSLSGLHLCALSFLGSWLSWNKHFGWAISYNSIRAMWVLFKCRDSKHLAFNISIYALYFNSAHTGKNEILAILCYIYNMIALNLSPNFRLYLKFKVICFAFIFRTNSEWIICWCVFAALAFPSTFAWNIYRKLFVTEKIISSAIVIAALMRMSFDKSAACVILPLIAVYLSKFVQSSSANFRCIKKLQKYVDPSISSLS